MGKTNRANAVFINAQSLSKAFYLSAVLLASHMFTGCESRLVVKSGDEVFSSPPSVHGFGTQFPLGELIPPSESKPFWSIGYGDFPVMMSTPALAGLANAFAREHLDFPGRDAGMPFVLDADKEYALECFTGDTVFGSYQYDTEQGIEFDESAELNLLLLTNFNDSDKAYLESMEGEVTAKEIALGTIAVFVPENNHVDGLTFEELKSLLTGETDNWSELGGMDQAIGLYYEADGELIGILDDLVLKGADLAGPVLENDTIGSGMFQQEVPVRVPFDDDPGAAVLTFAHNACDMGGYKVLAFDGSPLIYSCYAVYRAEDEDNAAGKFVEWILSEEGKSIVKQAGFIPAGDY